MMLVLPRVLVLPAERVEVVVELLASGMSACFRAANIDMPPWRRPDAMLSKWVPRRSIDLLQRTPPISPKTSIGGTGVFSNAAEGKGLPWGKEKEAGSLGIWLFVVPTVAVLRALGNLHVSSPVNLWCTNWDAAE